MTHFKYQISDFKSQTSNRKFEIATRRLSHFFTFALACCAAGVMAGGCESPSGGGGGSTGKSLFSQSNSGKERWTIRAIHTTAPGHQGFVSRLADQLKASPGINSKQVRVVSDDKSSTIYYGEYLKVASPNDANKLVFPLEYQRDMQILRGVVYNQSTPFFYAEPELIDKAADVVRGAYDVANAKGAYTLYIAIFYNTPEMSARKEAAEEAVKLLRQEGYPAYYRHEDLRSYLFVGDFETTDVVAGPDGQVHYGPRVEAMIARQPDLFQHLSQNGRVIKYQLPETSQMVPPDSYLVPLPREGAAAVASPPAPRNQTPAPFQSQ